MTTTSTSAPETLATTEYRLTVAPDEVRSLGWTHEITVFRTEDGATENIHSKLYRSLRSARADLVKRSDDARRGGRAGVVVTTEAVS